MQRRKSILTAVFCAFALLTFGLTAGVAAAHPGQHGSDDGHLLGTGEWGKIDLVGQFEVSGAEDDLIALQPQRPW